MFKLSVKKCFLVPGLFLVVGAMLHSQRFAIAFLVVPVFAETATERGASAESQSLFQPSAVLDSPKRSGGNIAETLAREPEFSSLISAFNFAAATAIIEEGGGNLTVFAPTNTAFQKNSAAYNKLLLPQNKDKLIRVLKYHIVRGEITPEKVDGGEVETVEGSLVKIKASSEGVIIGDRAKGIQPSIETNNGVIVRIDNLLLPPNLEL